MNIRHRGVGQPELLAVIVVICILVVLLLASIEAVRRSSPQGVLVAQRIETATKLYGYGAGFWILCAIAEDSAQIIGLGRHQWQSKRTKIGLRKGVVDRILYGIGGPVCAFTLLWCLGDRPSRNLLDTSLWYPLNLMLVTTLLICLHVFYRAVRRWNAVKHHAADYRFLFNPKALLFYIEVRRASEKQQTMNED